MAGLKEKIQSLNEHIGALTIAVKREDTPLYAKIMCWMTVAYALSPIDLIPDFIPVLGYLDDLIILPFLIWLSVKMIPEEIMRECIEQAKEMKDESPEKKKRYAIPIIVIWIIIIVFIVRLFLRK